MKYIKLHKEMFPELKKVQGERIKEKCDYCDTIITKETFGMLANKITCCKSLSCLSIAIGELDAVSLTSEGDKK